MNTFKNHIDQVTLLESPQGKIEKYKITDPSYINFIHRFENDIKWNNVKTIDDLDAAIDEGTASVVSPENYHVPINGINWASEKIALEGAALAGNQQAQQSLNTFNSDPEKAKKQVIDSINDGKDQVVNKWVEYLRYHDTYNLPFKYIILSSLLKKATKSRNPPVPLNQNTLARIYEKVTANPKDTFKIVDLYSSYYAQDAKASSETVPSGNGEWIKISSKANDPKNYEKNVDKLMTLACKTNWCIAQRSFAENYLSEGDFWIYFEDTPKGSIGRAAIRLSGDNTIKEIRGTLSGQELDDKYLPIVSDIVEKKDFKGKDTYLIDLLIKQKNWGKLKKLFSSGEIKADAAQSYRFASKMGFDLSEIPKEMIAAISSNAAWSYEFARGVGFDLSKIPNPHRQEMIAAISSSAEYSYGFASGVGFDLSKIPKEIITAISSSAYYSYYFAKEAGFDYDLSEIPEEIITGISSEAEHSYEFAKDVGFDLSKIPNPHRQEIITAISSNVKYSYSFGGRLGFDLSKIPKEMIAAISSKAYYSYSFAKGVEYDLSKIPKEIITAISSDAKYSYKFAEEVGYDLSKIPEEIIASIENSSMQTPEFLNGPRKVAPITPSVESTYNSVINDLLNG